MSILCIYYVYIMYILCMYIYNYLYIYIYILCIYYVYIMYILCIYYVIIYTYYVKGSQHGYLDKMGVDTCDTYTIHVRERASMYWNSDLQTFDWPTFVHDVPMQGNGFELSRIMRGSCTPWYSIRTIFLTAISIGFLELDLMLLLLLLNDLAMVSLCFTTQLQPENWRWNRRDNCWLIDGHIPRTSQWVCYPIT